MRDLQTYELFSLNFFDMVAHGLPFFLIKRASNELAEREFLF